MKLIYYECEYCKNNFKKETYLVKHQKNAKYCLTIQEEKKNKILKGDEGDEEFKQIETDIVTDLENKRLNDIHESFLEFENNKLELENQYNISVSNILEKKDLKNNIDDYYSIEKNKIDKLHELYSLFEKNKVSIEQKYENLILQFENKNWKDELKENKIKELELSFDLIKNKINNLIDISQDIDQSQDVLNQFIFNLNEYLKLNETHSETKSEIEIKSETNLKVESEVEVEIESETNSKVESEVEVEIESETNSKVESEIESEAELKSEVESDIEINYVPNNDIQNKLLYHLIVLLQDQKLNKNTLMYIIVELMRYINNFNMKGDEKKSSILYILRNFINTNEDDIENKEDMKNFLNIFSNDFVNIVSAISDKKIRIKLKPSCFFPICF